VALNIIQRRLGHANLGPTSIYLLGHRHRGDHRTAHSRRGPMMSATARRQL
jgi:hypothetical protein